MHAVSNEGSLTSLVACAVSELQAEYVQEKVQTNHDPCVHVQYGRSHHCLHQRRTRLLTLLVKLCALPQQQLILTSCGLLLQH
jgi:hypothetical protein